MESIKLVLSLLVVYQVQAICLHPSPAEGYTNSKYSGFWYEIGRIQTPGGASFQKDCVCDTANFTSEFETVGDGSITYVCRQKTVDGNETRITGILEAGEIAGNFAQRFAQFLPSVDYNVIWLDEDAALEYDCGAPFLEENYCVHFMSRYPTIEENKFNMMMNFVDELGLNTQNISYKATVQEGCW